MKSNKLLSSLNRAIKAAEELMSETNMSGPAATNEGTGLDLNGRKQKVTIKSIDFRNKRINDIIVEECPGGKCPPDEFKGRCCILDPALGWTCQGGLMATECAAMGGIYEAKLSCESQPPCGSSKEPMEEVQMPSTSM